MRFFERKRNSHVVTQNISWSENELKVFYNRLEDVSYCLLVLVKKGPKTQTSQSIVRIE